MCLPLLCKYHSNLVFYYSYPSFTFWVLWFLNQQSPTLWTSGTTGLRTTCWRPLLWISCKLSSEKYVMGEPVGIALKHPSKRDPGVLFWLLLFVGWCVSLIRTVFTIVYLSLTQYESQFFFISTLTKHGEGHGSNLFGKWM